MEGNFLMFAWESFTNQEQWKSYLKNLVKTNDRALLKAIVLIYNNQTFEERVRGMAIESNRSGFDKIDADVMGLIAKKIKSGQPLTKGELAKSRNKMQKYWRQLMIISKENMEAKREKLIKELNAEAYRQQELQEDCQDGFNEEVEKCLEEGKSCSYGICSECPLSVHGGC